MRKRGRKLLSLLLLAALCMGTACGEEQETASMVELSYGTGMSESGGYNRGLYGVNGINDVKGNDPSVIYVSEEQDPEYGGWYYMYKGTTDAADGNVVSAFLADEAYADVASLHTFCLRSKDLYSWEVCGALDGFTMPNYKEDWVEGSLWAPEVIRSPHDGKYYMYFSAIAKKNISPYMDSESMNEFDRLFLGVAVSDTPVGPFIMQYDIEPTTGARVPTINFQKGCGVDMTVQAIDASPFFDEDGTLYLYFVFHVGSNNSYNMICGVKMENMLYPDYSTFSVLTHPNYSTVNFTQGDPSSINTEGCEEYWLTGVNVNEGPFMIKHDGKYYMTYSETGYSEVTYSVHQAVSDDPLLGFTKLSQEQGNPVCMGSIAGRFMGTGHHSFVWDADHEDLWIAYHRHDTNNGYTEGRGRSISMDRVNWVTNPEGLPVLTANGPSGGQTWLSESMSGYGNLAKEATVTVNGAEGAEYLTDGVVPFYTVDQDMVCTGIGGDVTVTLSWDTPVTVRSLMVYNAYDKGDGFSNISQILFKLAEKPQWTSEEYEYAVITDLGFPPYYWDAESEDYVNCAPAVAEFTELSVTEITITIKAEDRLVAETQFGEANTSLKLTEIVVLGRDAE